MKMLTKAERKLLATAIFMQQNEKDIHTRAGQTVKPKDITGLFSIDYQGRKLMKQQSLSNMWYNIYSEIVEEEVVPVPERIAKEEQARKERAQARREEEEKKAKEEGRELPPVQEEEPEKKPRKIRTIEEIARNINNTDFSKDKKAEPKLVKSKTVKNQAPYFNYFRVLEEEYNSRPIDMHINVYDNGEKKVKFNFVTADVYHWFVELPFIDTKGFFSMNGSKYMFMYTPKNFRRYLEGIEEHLYLYHPFEKLAEEMVTAYKTSEGLPVRMKKEYFINAVSKCKGSRSLTLQAKVNRFINHAKQFYWEKDSTSPIVWFDSEVGTVGEHCFTNNILLDMQYEEIIEYGLVKGVDLLTGSTSTPAKRVSLASNYAILKDDQGYCYIDKVRDQGDLCDYLSDTKTAYPFFSRTSGKRQNSATVKDTQDLCNPLGMIKRVYIK